LISVLVFLLMRQIMPIAAGLAGGLALSSFGVVSRAMTWGTGHAQTLARHGVSNAAVATMDRVNVTPSRPSVTPSTVPSWRNE
jgi:hypothetical protein